MTYYNTLRVTGADREYLSDFYARELREGHKWRHALIQGKGFFIEYIPLENRLDRSSLIQLSKKYPRILFCQYYHSEDKKEKIIEAGVVHLKNGNLISKKIGKGKSAEKVFVKFMKSIREKMGKE